MQNHRMESNNQNSNLIGINQINMGPNNQIKIIPKRNEKQAMKNIIIGKNMINQEEDIDMKEDVKIEKNKK